MAAVSKQENAIVVDHVKKHFKVFWTRGRVSKSGCCSESAGAMKTARCCGTFPSR